MSSTHPLKNNRHRLHKLFERTSFDGESVLIVHRGHQFRVAFKAANGDDQGSTRLELVPTLPPLYPAGYSPLSDGAGISAPPRMLTHLPTIVLRHETKRDRTGKRMGLNREVQTGDLIFDDAIYIESDADDEMVHALIGGAKARRSIMTLLNYGFLRVELMGAKSPLALVGLGRASLLSVDSIQEVIEALVEIAVGMPAMRFSNASAKPRPMLQAMRWSLFPSLALGLLVWLYVVITHQYMVFGSGITKATLFVGGALWLMWMGMALIESRKRSTALRIMIFSALFATTTAPLVAYTGLRVTNAVLDTSPVAVMPAIVTAKRVHNSDDGDSYSVDLYVEGIGQDHFSISYEDYLRLPHRGKTARVAIRRGFWGWPWIEDITP